MKSYIFAMFFVASLPLFAAEIFTIVSDTKIDLDGDVLIGSCDALSKKEKAANKESGITGFFKQGYSELKKEIEGLDCTPRHVDMPGKKGTKRSEEKILAGQRALFVKKVSGPESLVVASCFADISKKGRILLLSTPKSENARSWFGKSMGFGLMCSQVEKLPK